MTQSSNGTLFAAIARRLDGKEIKVAWTAVIVVELVWGLLLFVGRVKFPADLFLFVVQMTALWILLTVLVVNGELHA